MEEEAKNSEEKESNSVFRNCDVVESGSCFWSADCNGDRICVDYLCTGESNCGEEDFDRSVFNKCNTVEQANAQCVWDLDCKGDRNCVNS